MKTEQDLQKTLYVLIDLSRLMEHGYDIWVNKLFVLPGTKLAKRMAAEGVEIGPSSMDPVFNYYTRLFWIASFCGNSRPLIARIQELAIFRQAPWLLDTGRVEEWLKTHNSMEAGMVVAQDFMAVDKGARAQARSEFFDDHDAVVLPSLTLAGCH
jgi:hypothetical protein